MSRSTPLYSRFVATDNNSPLEHRHGRVQLIGGDLYYSPNSQRNVNVPSVYNETPSRDCNKHDFVEFRTPVWWQPACPYLGFVPLRPNFAGVPFQDLFHVSYFPRGSYGGFFVDPQVILGWAQLEKSMKDAVDLILSHEQAPPLTWILATSLGCMGVYKRACDLRTVFSHSKAWFSVFMGALSYAIAISVSCHQERINDEMPHWFSFLHDRGYSQIWLSGIRSSTVNIFDFSVDRVGVFVQLYQRHRQQFSVDWLCTFGVPVWYPWGIRESRASTSDRCLARFAPPAHLLQETGTFLTRNPSPQPLPTTELHPTEELHVGAYDCKLLFFCFCQITLKVRQVLQLQQ